MISFITKKNGIC